MTRRNHSSRPVARLARSLLALAGIGLAAAAPTHAQTVAPSAAPASWVRYAESATLAVTGLLQAENETAARLRTYLDGTRPAPDQPTAPLMLKLWVDRGGTVSRIDFTPFAHAQPNEDLHSLIVGQKLAGVPPKGMLLPLRIVVQLDAPRPTPPQPASGPSGLRT